MAVKYFEHRISEHQYELVSDMRDALKYQKHFLRFRWVGFNLKLHGDANINFERLQETTAAVWK